MIPRSPAATSTSAPAWPDAAPDATGTAVGPSGGAALDAAAAPASPVGAHGQRDRVTRLRTDAAEAAQVRMLQTLPDVQALRVEQVRVQVDRLMWTGIVLGLAFTMVNVQAFASAGAPRWSPTWWAAWLLDPMVSLVLIAVLRAEQITARYQVATGPWVRRARWFTLGATYVMNTWNYWAALDPGGVVLHSVPPLTVFVAAEAITDLRDKLTEAVHRAADIPAPARDTVPADPGNAAPPLASPSPDPQPRTGDSDTERSNRNDSPVGADDVGTPEPHPQQGHPDEVEAGPITADADPASPSPTASSVSGDTPLRQSPSGEQMGAADGLAGSTPGAYAGAAADPRVPEILRWLEAGEEIEGVDVARRLTSARTNRPISVRSGRRLLKLAKDLAAAGVVSDSVSTNHAAPHADDTMSGTGSARHDQRDEAVPGPRSTPEHDGGRLGDAAHKARWLRPVGDAADQGDPAGALGRGTGDVFAAAPAARPATPAGSEAASEAGSNAVADSGVKLGRAAR